MTWHGHSNTDLHFWLTALQVAYILCPATAYMDFLVTFLTTNSVCVAKGPARSFCQVLLPGLPGSAWHYWQRITLAFKLPTKTMLSSTSSLAHSTDGLASCPSDYLLHRSLCLLMQAKFCLRRPGPNTGIVQCSMLAERRSGLARPTVQPRAQLPVPKWLVVHAIDHGRCSRTIMMVQQRALLPCQGKEPTDLILMH